MDFYDVSDPSRPTRVGTSTPVIGTATRDVSLVQRPDGRVLSLEANQSGAIRAVDVTAPAAPVPVGSFSGTSTGQGCRPFTFAQGVSTNESGSRAYAAFGDAGLFRLDISNPAPGVTFPRAGELAYPAAEEGNSFRFVPNVAETAALATDAGLPAMASDAAGLAAIADFPGCPASTLNVIIGGAAPPRP